MLGGPSKGNPIPTLIEFEKGLKARRRQGNFGREEHSFPRP